jgi:hypothetical protein
MAFDIHHKSDHENELTDAIRYGSPCPPSRSQNEINIGFYRYYDAGTPTTLLAFFQPFPKSLSA